MAGQIGQIGESPYAPGKWSEQFVPDQLAAGNLQLVTLGITIGGAAFYKRGTVMGQITEGTVAAAAGKAATGTITFAGVPAVGDTLTLAGSAITFITNEDETNGLNFSLGTPDLVYPTVQAFLDDFVPYLQASADANLVKLSYAAAGGIITVTAVTSGAAGNALTLAENSAEIAVSGATLAGGANNTGNPTFGAIVRGAQFKQGNYVLTFTDATHFGVTDPTGDALPAGQTGVAYADAQLGFTLTAGGVAAVAGDSFIIKDAPGSGLFILSVPTAADGSQAPVCILVDDYDATNGPVNGAGYFMGEFNSNAVHFDPGWALPQLIMALAPKGIFLKGSVSASDPY